MRLPDFKGKVSKLKFLFVRSSRDKMGQFTFVDSKLGPDCPRLGCGYWGPFDDPCGLQGLGIDKIPIVSRCHLTQVNLDVSKLAHELMKHRLQGMLSCLLGRISAGPS